MSLRRNIFGHHKPFPHKALRRTNVSNLFGARFVSNSEVGGERPANLPDAPIFRFPPGIWPVEINTELRVRHSVCEIPASSDLGEFNECFLSNLPSSRRYSPGFSR